MLERDDDTTIGRGGWGLVVASGLISFVVLRFLFDYLLFPSLAFALAIALVVLLILYRLAVAVNRHDDAEAERQVRRIVPASALSEGTTRVSGIEGARASPVVAVPVRPEQATPVPQRPAATVTPLAKLDPAPIILQRQAEAAPQSVARPAEPVPVAPVAATPAPSSAPASAAVSAAQPSARPAAKPKAEAKAGTKEGTKSASRTQAAARSGAKASDGAADEVAVRAAPEAPAKARPSSGFKGKAELKARAAATPAAAAAPEASAKPRATKGRTATKPKATKAPATGLVRLAAPRNGKADDLKMIDGVGPALERLMNSLGFYHFDQIAAWTEADVALVDAEMKSFKGRATRDKWVLQAKILANGGTAEEAAAAAKA